MDSIDSYKSSKSLFPLAEIIIAIGIFAIAVVLTLQMFFLAKFLGDKTSDTAAAICEIQNVAESIKLLKTNAEITDYMNNSIGNFNADGSYNLYYGEDWKSVDSLLDVMFVMKIAVQKDNYTAGILYKFNLELYKSKPYPFINDKNVKVDKNYKPVLASVNTSDFVAGGVYIDGAERGGN